MMDDNTMQFLGTGQHWESSITQRDVYDNWLSISMGNVQDRAQDKVEQLLSEPQQPFLSRDQKQELQQITDTFPKTD